MTYTSTVPVVSPSEDVDESVSAQSALERDGRGRFLPGNAAALEHGLFSEQARQFAALHDEARTFLDAQLGDEGDVDALSARRRSLLGYRARVHRRLLQLDEAIERRGLCDGKGRLRVAWLQRFEALVRTAQSLDSLLGLNRRAKRVESVDEWAARVIAEKGAAGHQDASSDAVDVPSAHSADPLPAGSVTSAVGTDEGDAE